MSPNLRRIGQAPDAWLALGAGLALCVGLAWACAPGPDDESGVFPPSQAPAPLQDAELLGLGPKHGEYGLWVRIDGDSLRASWITQTAGPGYFAAQLPGGNGDLPVRTTSSGVAHTGAMEIPGADEVVLRYGADGDPADRHETTIRLAGIHRPAVEIPQPDSLYVIGDIHGEYTNMVQVLENAGLIDDDLRWSGERNHLVVLGDMMSRGDHPTAVLWFLYRLEKEAEDAGGRIHVVLGNHEFMVVLDDLRYVQPKEQRIAEVHGVPYHALFHPQHSVLGYWLMSKPVAIQIDGVLLAHGGIAEKYTAYGLQALDDSVSAWTREEPFLRWPDNAYWEDPNLALPVDSVGWERRVDFLWEPTSPIWHREYAESRQEGEQLNAVLDHFGARIHVVGHTPVEAIEQRYGGRLILTNTFPFAAEVLLLVRDRRGPGGYTRWSIGFEGPPNPLPTRF